ncbi:hypothetical protein HMPREF9005_0860 [Actinomyces sp. oral taxon 178 str. F0338]|nr:hypothetical protein HMPREF9005_0860 [Actinomyces sp. oral taxon 178 str. F0338]
MRRVFRKSGSLCAYPGGRPSEGAGARRRAVLRRAPRRPTGVSTIPWRGRITSRYSCVYE